MAGHQNYVGVTRLIRLELGSGRILQRGRRFCREAERGSAEQIVTNLKQAEVKALAS
jgi:hypothetical protein